MTNAQTKIVDITSEAFIRLGIDPQEVIKDIESLKAVNITPAQIRILFLLRKQPQTPVSSS